MRGFTSLLKLSAILWIVWGLVHILAGLLTINGHLAGDISKSIEGIADATDFSNVAAQYPAAASAIIAQHGFNLLWVGLVTFICGILIWRNNVNAIFLAAIVGGLTDLGYFLFLDLGGYVRFIPGTLMTIVSALAIVMSLYAFFKGRSE